MEIVHYPNTDIVINNDAQYAYLGHQLAELFKNGTPKDWEALAPGFDPQTPAEPSDSDKTKLDTGPTPGMAAGEVDGKKLLVKVKKYSGPRYQARKAEIAANAAKSGLSLQSELFAAGMGQARRLNSVLNEIAIAPKLKRSVAEEEFQALANKYGFRSFRYVEPIIGIIDKKTGVKRMVYEYIANTENLVGLMKKDNEIRDKILGGTMEHDLEEILVRNGIDFGKDTGEHQVLVDAEKNLYLIDAETYHRTEIGPDIADLPPLDAAELKQLGL
ncbi:MAG TPA: hypothetical protein VFK97_01470 [Candidatus Saccharimonadales bacterium]|nr:hypothetical protein [Candidatus Saccharimonadales bacterium]